MAALADDQGQMTLEAVGSKVLVTASWGNQSRRALLPRDAGTALYRLICGWDDIRVALAYVREVADRYALAMEYRA